jgi:putative membrane protein insertion efficiency factor
LRSVALQTRDRNARRAWDDPGSAKQRYALHRIRETHKNSMTLDSLFDASRKTPRLLGRGLVKAYRYTFSPLVGYRCRHLPTCSDYADQALDRFGLWAGGWMTLARLLRCQPWGTSGLDFVAESLPPLAQWYLPWRYARWRGTNASSRVLEKGP